MIDIVNIGEPRKAYPNPPYKELEMSPHKYLQIAKRLIRINAPKIRPDLAVKMLRSEDAISNIATVIMMADWRWNGRGTREGFRKQCVKYALYSLLERDMKRNTHGIRSLNFNVGEDIELVDILASQDPLPEKAQIEQEETTKLNTILERSGLTGQQEQCLKMHYLDEMTMANVGKQLGVSRQRVAQIIQEGLQSLRRKGAMGIHADFATGNAGEKLVSDLMAAAGIIAHKNEDVATRAFWDLTCGDCTIEVKNDVYAERSGNIAIEVHNPKSNKPSGLNITRADLWCHVAFGKVYCTTVSNLKTFVEDTVPKRIIEAGGDKNATLYLYGAEDILPVFTRIDHLSPAELRTKVEAWLI